MDKHGAAYQLLEDYISAVDDPDETISSLRDCHTLLVIKAREIIGKPHPWTLEGKRLDDERAAKGEAPNG